MPRITYAYPYTDAGGTEHKPDSTDDVPDEIAADLLASGFARLADESKKGGK